MGNHLIHISEMRRFPGAVYCGRPRRSQPWGFGNPFRWQEGQDPLQCLLDYGWWLVTSGDHRARWQRENLHTLLGQPLACFCRRSDDPLDGGRWCHTEVIEIILRTVEAYARKGMAPAVAAARTFARIREVRPTRQEFDEGLTAELEKGHG